MEEFQKVLLSEVTTLITKGTTPTTLGYAFTDSGVNFIKAESVTLDGQIDASVFAHIDEETHKKLKRSQIQEGDILFSIAGMKLGKSAVVKSQHVPANTNQAVAIIRADRSKALSDFLHYHFLNPNHYRYVNAITAQAAQPNINLKQVGDLPIALPSLPKQQRIAGILSAYDELIENSQRRVRILEMIARALYREWFINFRFPGHEKHAQVSSPIGNIPAGWEVKKLGEVAFINRSQISRRTAPKELHYIDISSVSPGQIDSTTTYAFADAPGRARRIVQHGDVLWSCVRPNRRSHAQVMHPELNTIASTGFAVLTATQVPLTFLYLATTSDEFVAYLTNNATGAAYPAVTAATFEKAVLLIPPSPLLKRFGDATLPMAEHIHTLQRQIHNLRRTRDLLLPRLLSGKITL